MVKKNIILVEVTQKQNTVITSSQSHVGPADESVGLWFLVWEKCSIHQSRKGLFVERGMKMLREEKLSK